MHRLDPLIAEPLLRATAHELATSAVHVGQLAARVGMPDHLWRLLSQRARQGFFSRQRESSLRYFFLQAEVQRFDLLIKPDVFNGYGRRLRQLHGNVDISLGKVAFVLVGHLEQANGLPVTARQRHGQEAAQSGYCTVLEAQVAPARMGFEFGVRQANRTAKLVHRGSQPCGAACLAQRARCGIFFGKRDGVHGLKGPTLASQGQQRLVGTDHAACLINSLLQRGLQCLVPGNGLGCVDRALQGKQVLLLLVLGQDLRAHVIGHHQPRRSAFIVDHAGRRFNVNIAAVLAAVHAPIDFLAGATRHFITQPLGF